MESKELLRHIGLNEKESVIYLSLLETGEAPVLQIAKKAGVKRPTAYLILNSLEAKGFASKVSKKKQTIYVPQHPRKLLTEAEVRLAEIKEAMPQFEAMLQSREDKPRVVIYEGKEALDRAYDDYFLVKGELLCFSNTELLEEVLSRTVNKLVYLSWSAEYSARELLDDSEKSRAYASKIVGPRRGVRLMPKDFSPFATDIGVFGNTTLITSAKKEFFTVKIESAEIAHAFRSMFEAMWKISKPISVEAT